MVNYFSNKGYKTGLAVGCLLAALCIAGMLGIIFFPHIIGFSLIAISVSKAFLGCNAFSAALGLLIWQDPTIRRQSNIEWTSTSYPLLLGFIGYTIAHTFAFFGKWIGKGMDKIALALNRHPIQPERLQFNKSTSEVMREMGNAGERLDEIPDNASRFRDDRSSAASRFQDDKLIANPHDLDNKIIMTKRY